MTNNLTINTTNLQADLDWLKDIIDRRFSFTFTEEYSDPKTYEKKKYVDIEEIKPPQLEEENSIYAQFIYQNELSFETRLLLILGLAPHISPQLLDHYLAGKNDDFVYSKAIKRYSHNLNELGGITSGNFRGFIPTGLTWLFLTVGYDLQKRMELLAGVNEGHLLIKKKIVTFLATKPHEPTLSGAIAISPEWLRVLTIGDIQAPTSQ